jgi:hypothetical protein
MNRLVASLLLCFGLLFATRAAEPASAQTVADKGQMYEDIEIMGRILDHALHLPRHSTRMVPVNYPGNFGGFNDGLATLSGGFGGFQGGNGLGGGLGGSSINLGNLGGQGMPVDPSGGGLGLGGLGLGGLGGGLGGFQGGLVPVSFPAFPKTQGTYVKDHGVVFTIVLPPPEDDPKPTSVPSLAKPPTEWERVRQQLRGEKSDSSSPKPKPKEPSVADLVLEALAKNGQHLSLGDKESLTVSIVFRPEEEVSAPEAAVGQGVSMNYLKRVLGQPDLAQALNFNSGVSTVTTMPDESASTPDKKSSPDDKKPASGGTPGDATDKGSSPRDYELLGDLHLKQGQGNDALKAYYKALKNNADAQHAAAMYLKIAQLYLSSENEAEARKAMDQARELLAKAGADKKQTPKPKKAESPLPSRLIITVPKELLDRAGTGRISLEEFKKAATVEYLPFASR